jgi:ubiquinone/menaquinone biosynthesis C-methylase UbiE
LSVERTLSHEEARQFYDAFGAKQDTQGWYEDPANAVMLAKAKLRDATNVVEFGCGTGRLAAKLLRSELDAGCRYAGFDSSRTMCGLATERLQPWQTRSKIELTSGAPKLTVADASADRVLATYVLDLLALSDIERFLTEAHRVLRPGGLLCVVGLTPGEQGVSRFVTALWRLIHRSSPARVGGCRPLKLADYLPVTKWANVEREVVVSWGLASEVVIASKAAGA